MAEGLDELEYALHIEQWEGFGFQCSDTKKCLYIAQVFYMMYSDVHQEARQTEMPESALALVHDFIPPNEIWVTDFLGREWITIPISRFNDVERIFNVLLQNNYYILTHTTPKTYFKPGEVFSRRELDLHMIQAYEENRKLIAESYPQRSADSIADYLKQILNVRSLLHTENWATSEGLDFCAKLRAIHRKNPLRKKTRFENKRYTDACIAHNVLFAGGWFQYSLFTLTRTKEEPPLKKPSPFQEEEIEECMICLDKAADTLVLPCEHRVVCDACSKKLRATGDSKICVRCRRPISYVAYAKDNSLESKN